MRIKPVLVPDHDANDLRRLMDRFAEAATGPTRQQLAESRAAVAAAQGVAESSNELYGLRVGDTVKAVVNGKRVQGDVIDIFPETMEVELLLRGVNAGRTITVDVRDTEALSEQGVAEGKKRSDRYHIVGKDGNPASLASYADQASAVKDRDEKHPGAEVRQVGPRGKIKGVSEGPDKGWVPNPDNPGYYIHRSDLPQTGKVSDPAKAKLGRIINKYFGQIYDYGDGDESLNYLDNNAPLWFDLFDKHDGDIDAIIANEPADVLKQAALELKNVANDLKYELDEQVVTEGFMDTVKQAFNDCVVGYPQGTSEGQFIQGWARAIRAETGRDIPLEKLTRLYQDYAERSDELMQSHGTLDEGSAEDNLNELDKSTLGSYVKKAAADVNTKSRDAQQHKDMWAGDFPVRGAKKQARQNQADIDKRVGGISRAVDRLAAEDVVEGEGMAEMWGNPYDDDKVDAINAANPPKRSTPYTPPSTPAKHHTYDRNKAVAANISGEDSAAYDRFTGRDKDMAEATGQQLNIQQLATISDEALDNAYHYGRSTPGNTFGWQANLKSAAYAKQMIDQGVTDIEAISDAIHKGWNVTARAFVQNPEQFSDTEKLQAAGKLEAKLQQRAKLMNIGYAQLPDEEQEKDRVVAKALLQALKGQQGVSEGSMYSDEEVSWEKGGRRAPTGAFRNPAAEPMPVNKYIAQELDTLLKLAQDQVDDITNRSRDGYGNKKSGGLEDAIFELSGVSNGFHSSMAEGVAELQELNSGLPRIGNWIMRNLKKVGNRIDLPQLIKQETSNNQGVTETHDNDARAVLRNRIVADVLNFYSLNDRIPSIKEFSRPVRAKLNALEFDERSTVFRQAVVQALKLLGKQGMSAALTLDEHGDPWEDPNYDPRGGGETRSPEQIAKDNAEHAILSKKLGLKNTNKLPDIKDDMLKMMNHFRSQHSDKKDVSETADGVKYGVFAKGGSVGSQRFRDDPLKTFDTKEEATADARRRRSGLSKGERGYYRMGYVVKPIKGEVEEGLKQKVAGAVLAGAAALGAGGAGAQSTDRFDPAWGTSGYNTSIRSNVSSTKSMNAADPSKDVDDFQKRIQTVTGPNAKGEYKVVVIQGNDIVSHYVTKTPPPGWMAKNNEVDESKTEEGMIDNIKNIKNTVRAANYDRLARRSNSQAVAGGGLAPPAQFRALSDKGDQRAQKAQDIRKGDVAQQVEEGIDPIEQLRADIRRFAQ